MVTTRPFPGCVSPATISEAYPAAPLAAGYKTMFREGMALRAMRLQCVVFAVPSLVVHIAHVVGLRSEKKVLDIDASRSIAPVENMSIGWQDSTRNNPRSPMGLDDAARTETVIDTVAPSIVGGEPEDTAGIGFWNRLLPESGNPCFRLCHMPQSNAYDSRRKHFSGARSSGSLTAASGYGGGFAGGYGGGYFGTPG